ncbi:MAG: hypothetical protein Q8K58_05255 [Acidimicrobiales bacterium]|nr:hypothetical protein [Acidimicrobiales bacterium]
MTDLPGGWVGATMTELSSDSGYGTSAKCGYEESGIGVLRIPNVQKGSIDLADLKRAPKSLELNDHLRLRADDLLLVRTNGSRDLIGRCAPVTQDLDYSFASYLIRFRMRSEVVDTRFVSWMLSSPTWRERLEEAAASSAGQYNLSLRTLGPLPVVVPPLAEQERIVAAIEEAFSKLDAGEAGLRTVRQLLKRMRDAVLAAAVTGRLVPQNPTDTPAAKLLAGLGVEALDSPVLGPLPELWAWASMGDVTVIGGGIQKQPKRAPANNPTPFLRVANVGRGTLDLDDVHSIEVFDGELDRYGLERGDLLVVEGNGSPDQIGRSAMWHGEIDPCVHQNHLIRVRPSEVLLPEFLELYWNSPDASRRVQSVASSTSGLHTLSTGKLKVLPVAIPPPEEQVRIVSEVDRQVSFLDACEQGVDDGRACAAALRRSVLKAAFEGNLVSQDPSDEPASVLVERIRADRAAAPRAPRRSRRPA